MEYSRVNWSNIYKRRKDVIAGDLINGKAGIGYKDNVNGKGRVMAITTPYNEERGFAIALVLWGVK